MKKAKDIDITKLSKTELKALAYENICSINRFKHSLSVIENEIAKREQAEAAKQAKEMAKPAENNAAKD